MFLSFSCIHSILFILFNIFHSIHASIHSFLFFLLYSFHSINFLLFIRCLSSVYLFCVIHSVLFVQSYSSQAIHCHLFIVFYPFCVIHFISFKPFRSLFYYIDLLITLLTFVLAFFRKKLFNFICCYFIFIAELFYLFFSTSDHEMSGDFFIFPTKKFKLFRAVSSICITHHVLYVLYIYTNRQHSMKR